MKPFKIEKLNSTGKYALCMQDFKDNKVNEDSWKLFDEFTEEFGSLFYPVEIFRLYKSIKVNPEGDTMDYFMMESTSLKEIRQKLRKEKIF